LLFVEAVFALAMMEDELLPSHERSNIPFRVLDENHGQEAGALGEALSRG